MALNGKTNSSETPKNETPNTPVDVTVETSPSFWQRANGALKTGYNAIPLKREGVAFAIGAAVMYGVQRLAMIYLENSDDTPVGQ